MSEPLHLASPVRLFHDTSDAVEVLALSFNSDLAFFERFALGAARALGAVVTVISDADYVTVDPRAVKWAGRTYSDVRALCQSGGAFHPKLLAIIGESTATVAFGSGNVTTAGWHGNAEIWAVLRATAEEVPETLRDLATWLQQLPEALHLSGPGRSALTRVAHRLQNLPGAPSLGPKLVTSLHAPILSQIPAGPVDDLVTYAPFYDPSAAALRALINRLEPRHVEVCFQSEQGFFDGAALIAATARVETRFTAISEERYHHGKLIEWRIGNEWHALIGSPNITAAALLRQMSRGGNCEIGLITAIAETLRPSPREELDQKVLGAIINASPFEPRPGGPRLLDATLEPAGMRLTLASVLESAATVQAGGETWTSIGSVPPNVVEAVVPTLMTAGTAVRVVDDDGNVSRVVVVADPIQVLRPTTAQHARHETTERDLFTDPQLFLAFHRDLIALREFLAQMSRDSKGPPTRATNIARPPEYLTWEDRLRIYEDHLGGHITSYGLALPRLAAPQASGWVKEVLDPGTKDPDPTADEDEPPEPDSHEADLSDADRQRYRRWCTQLADQAPTLPALGRAIAVRIMLRAGAGRIWDKSADWLRIASKVVAALSSSEPEFDDERTAIGSTAAVAVSVLRSQLWDRYTETEESRAVERAIRAVRPLLLDRTMAQVRQICGELESAYGIAVDEFSVDDLAEHLAKDDPIEEAIEALADHGVSAHRTGDVITLEQPVKGDPSLHAVEVLNHCHVRSCAVRARSSAGADSLVVWNAPCLIVLDRNTKRIRGQIFELRGTMRPGDYARLDRRLPTQHLVTEWFGVTAPESVRQFLEVPGLGAIFPEQPDPL